MDLSVSTRRPAPSSASWAGRQTTRTPLGLSRYQQEQHSLRRKQHSFIGARSHSISGSGPVSSTIACSSVVGILKRDASLGRSFDADCKQKLSAATSTQKRKNCSLLKQSSVNDELNTRIEKNGYMRTRECRMRSTKNSSSTFYAHVNNYTGHKKNSVLVAWSSANSLLRAFNTELEQFQENTAALRNTTSLSDAKYFANKLPKTNKPQLNAYESPTQLGSEQKAVDLQRINLNIVLPQTIRTKNYKESNCSDVDSASETADNILSKETLSDGAAVKDTPIGPLQRRVTITSVRRTHFQSNRSDAVTVNPTSVLTLGDPLTQASGARTTSCFNTRRVDDFIVEPQQATAPVRRAMSAPVRSIEVNSRSVISACKPKPRRRKIIARNISCDPCDIEFCDPTLKRDKGSLLDGNALNLQTNGKLPTRTRATSATGIVAAGVGPTTDVVTLVSLISSDLSDSDKEEDNSSGNHSAYNTGRAPHLRKTGKSVSFQEAFVYTPSYQLAGKEYSHMIRRDSVASFASRGRSNRPPTAPPGTTCPNEQKLGQGVDDVMTATRSLNDTIDPNRQEMVIDIHMGGQGGLIESTTGKENISTKDEVYPNYVHSMKERECWKLFQKMCTKGVNVTYDTILRGMLTPTEFRQLQKQKELEEAKRIALEELISRNIDGETGRNDNSEITTVVADIKGRNMYAA